LQTCGTPEHLGQARFPLASHHQTQTLEEIKLLILRTGIGERKKAVRFSPARLRAWPAKAA
jgi:hypothetical protein